MSTINGNYNNYNNSDLYSNAGNQNKNQSNSSGLKPVSSTSDLNNFLSKLGSRDLSNISYSGSTGGGDSSWASSAFNKIKGILNGAEKTDQGTYKLTDSQKDRILDVLTNGEWSKAKETAAQTGTKLELGNNVNIESTQNGGVKLNFKNDDGTGKTSLELTPSGNVSGSYNYDANGTQVDVSRDGDTGTTEANIQRGLGNGTTANARARVNDNGTASASAGVDNIRFGRDVSANVEITSNEDGKITGKLTVNADIARMTGLPEGSKLDFTGTYDSAGNTINATLSSNAIRLGNNAAISISGFANGNLNTGNWNGGAQAQVRWNF